MKNVLVIDDHLITAQGVGSIIKEHKNFHLMGVCVSTNEALEFIGKSKNVVDIIIVDLYIPGETIGFGIKTMRAHFPVAKVICLTASDGFHDSKLAREMGADIIFHKSVCIATLLKSCLNEKEYENGVVTVGNKLSRTFTSRQIDIIKRLLEGGSDKEIGIELGISPETVRTHIRKMFNNTDTNSRQRLANWVRDNGYRY